MTRVIQVPDLCASDENTLMKTLLSFPAASEKKRDLWWKLCGTFNQYGDEAVLRGRGELYPTSSPPTGKILMATFLFLCVTLKKKVGGVMGFRYF